MCLFRWRKIINFLTTRIREEKATGLRTFTRIVQTIARIADLIVEVTYFRVRYIANQHADFGEDLLNRYVVNSQSDK